MYLDLALSSPNHSPKPTIPSLHEVFNIVDVAVVLFFLSIRFYEISNTNFIGGVEDESKVLLSNEVPILIAQLKMLWLTNTLTWREWHINWSHVGFVVLQLVCWDLAASKSSVQTIPSIGTYKFFPASLRFLGVFTSLV